MAEPTTGSTKSVLLGATAGLVTMVLVGAGFWIGLSEDPSAMPVPSNSTATSVEAQIADTTIPAEAPTTTAAEVAPGAVTHEGVYRDGKLYLIGTLPNRSYADAFVAKAAEVIGAENVIDQYVIDPSAQVPSAGNVRVDEQFIFDKNSSTVSPEYHDILNLGIAVMNLNPQVTATVTGHTDDKGSLELNQRLSQERAQAVVDYIVSQGGIDPARFTATGLGPSAPIAPNDSDENRAKNRRIEVTLSNLIG